MKKTKTKNNAIKIWVADLNRYFAKEDTHMLKKYIKRCSTSLIIREMQTKTVMRYHLTPDRMAMIKKYTYNLSQKESNWLHTFSLPRIWSMFSPV